MRVQYWMPYHSVTNTPWYGDERWKVYGGRVTLHGLSMLFDLADGSHGLRGHALWLDAGFIWVSAFMIMHVAYMVQDAGHTHGSHWSAGRPWLVMRPCRPDCHTP